MEIRNTCIFHDHPSVTMTAENLLEHDASPSFVWDEAYRRQLQTLADTDEMTSDIHWPSLKDGIKHLLKETLHHWPSSSSPILHPAATLIPLHNSTSFEEASGSGTSLAGFTNGNGTAAAAAATTRNGTRAAAAASPSDDAAQALNNRFAAEGASSAVVDDDENAANPHDQDIPVREVDMQAFFPSKRQAPGEWKGSWGKRIDTEEELNRERRVVFGMLDDFDTQPPFTIQRLAELVLQPTEHHHTVPKYISALKRLLSVTATRDAFPAHPGEEDGEEDELMAELGGGAAPANEAEMINGASGVATPSTAASRSRRATPVPGSPTTAPLFSPIPFLMKSGDEGMPGAGPDASNSSDSDAQRSFDATDSPMVDRDVPIMELGGADRTTEEATEHARKTGKGAGTNKPSITETVHEAEKEVAAAAAAAAVTNIDDASLSASSSAGDISAEAAPHVPQPVDAGVDATPDTDHTSSTLVAQPTSSPHNATTTEPLGVPAGPVDEMDQVGEKHGQLPPLGPGSIAGGARAFSSTTTTATTAAMNDESQSGEADERAAATTANDNTDSESGRMLKRVRSERHLGGGDGGAR